MMSYNYDYPEIGARSSDGNDNILCCLFPWLKKNKSEKTNSEDDAVEETENETLTTSFSNGIAADTVASDTSAPTSLPANDLRTTSPHEQSQSTSDTTTTTSTIFRPQVVPDLLLDQDAPAVNWKEDTCSSFYLKSKLTFDTASLSSSDYDDDDESEDASLGRDYSDHIESFDLVPDIDDVDSINEFIFADVDEYNTKDTADAALAWSALAMILSAPAPSAVSKLSSRSASKQSSTELDDVLFPILEEQNIFGDESNDEIPSLAEKDASLSPQRKRREYRYPGQWRVIQ
jgi:hypothetical protein